MNSKKYLKIEEGNMNRELIFIQESLHTFKPSERKVAEFILEKPADVINISIQKLAENTKVSEATIIRLSRSLQCKGFKELKLKIAYDLAKAKAEKNLEGYEDIPRDDSVSSMIHSVSQNNIQAIHNTAVCWMK